MSIVAFSDVHLGFDRSNSKDLLEFLRQLQSRSDLRDLVIVGDFIDLWRRDVIGLEFEVSRYIEELKTLQKTTNVHYVVGNHDFHVKYLKRHGYPFKFSDSLTLERLGYKVKFLHGYQCDPIQNLLGPNTSEILCWTLSDEAGEMKSKLWDLVGSKMKMSREEFDEKVDLLRTPPEERARAQAFGPFTDFVNCIKANLKITGQNEFIVFGHTHRPFIDIENRVANTGCWIKGSKPTNTYFEFKEWPPRIVEFRGKELKSTAISSLKF